MRTGNSTKLKSLLATFLLPTITVIGIASAAAAAKETPDFAIKPYLQLGNYSGEAQPESEELVWFAQNKDSNWKVETKNKGDAHWSSAHTSLHKNEIFDAPAPLHPLYKFTCELHGLTPSSTFDYRVIADGKPIFSSWAKTRKAQNEKFTFAVFGDCGAGSEGQKLVAWQCYKAEPDFVVIPGDIAYDAGLFSEYLRRFFPIYNNDEADMTKGVPFMRSIPFVGVIGNHDIALGGGHPCNLDRFPDALAYFLLWDPPMNGPQSSDKTTSRPLIKGDQANQKAFLKSAGSSFPRTAMFSFDYGNSHWLVLDANPYMNWDEADIRKWVDDDLKASNATWKFVTFHQPGFSDDMEHSKEQRMRLLADIFERNRVDVVFGGHAHCYERSLPLTFKPASKHDGIASMIADGSVPGEYDLDKKFDGKTDTVPHGVVYIVTGCGGAHLYPAKHGTELGGNASHSFLMKYIGNIHSFTRCRIDGEKLELAQVSSEGQVLDEISVTKK
jgi:3',5'-cyclic AMP phosphodiesterase CpdA